MKLKNKLMSDNKVIKYSKDFMKIKFESDDDLPLGKILNTPVCVIIIRGVFEKLVNITQKFYYTNLFMSMKKILIL